MLKNLEISADKGLVELRGIEPLTSAVRLKRMRQGMADLSHSVSAQGRNMLGTKRESEPVAPEEHRSEWTNGSPPYVPLPRAGSDDLYFIQADSGPVKIGRGKNPASRLRELQVGCFEQLSLIHIAEGRGYEEKVWHWAFSEARLKGEWFQFTDDLDHAIACMMRNDRWWEHLTPPVNFPVEDEDDIVDWHIGVHIALVGKREEAEFKATMTSRESA